MALTCDVCEQKITERIININSPNNPKSYVMIEGFDFHRDCLSEALGKIKSKTED